MEGLADRHASRGLIVTIILLHTHGQSRVVDGGFCADRNSSRALELWCCLHNGTTQQLGCPCDNIRAQSILTHHADVHHVVAASPHYHASVNVLKL